MKKLLALFVSVMIVFSSISAFAYNFNAHNEFEVEALTIAANQGEYETLEGADFSGGKAIKLKATQGENWPFNDFIRFYAPVGQRGLWNIKAKVRKGPDCGIIQLWFSDTNTRVNKAIDMYSASEETATVDFGNFYMDTGETRWFEFAADGKNSASSGYNFVIDTLEFTFVEEYKTFSDNILDYNIPEPQANSNGYKWGEVVENGTGCSTHIVFHPTEKDLLYMGLDMGGLYRWDQPTQSWKFITEDFTIQEQEGFAPGIDGIALDYNNPDVIYVAMGMYPNKGEQYMGHVYKSVDRGENWIDTGFSGYFNANGNFRHTKECIAVDPNNSNIVFCATVDGRLVKSTDGFKTWDNAELPVTTANYSVFPRSIVFDKNKNDGTKTTKIYLSIVGDVSAGAGLYVSEDGGQTWNLTDCPLNGIDYPANVNISNDGTLVVGSSSGAYMLKNGVWSEVSPIQGKAFVQISIAPANPDFLITSWAYGPVGSYGQYTYYSKDAGKSWVLINDIMIRDNAVAPRCEYCGYFANTSGFAIDPNNEARIFTVGWQNCQKTEDIFAENPVWSYAIRGVEHGCV